MRWVFRLIGLVVVLVVLAVGAVFLVPTDRIAGLAADQFKTATGRTLTIEGDVRPMLYPEIGISLGGVAIENAPWSENGDMVAAEKIAVSVKLMPLFSGDVQVTGCLLYTSPSPRDS